MGILGWILFGLVVGIIAKFIMPGKDPGGIIVTIILGIVGALLGGLDRFQAGAIQPDGAQLLPPVVNHPALHRPAPGRADRAVRW